MQLKMVWLITLASVLTMTLIVFSGVSSVAEIEIDSWVFALTLWSFFVAVVVPTVHLFVSAYKGKRID